MKKLSATSQVFLMQSVRSLNFSTNEIQKERVYASMETIGARYAYQLFALGKRKIKEIPKLGKQSYEALIALFTVHDIQEEDWIAMDRERNRLEHELCVQVPDICNSLEWKNLEALLLQGETKEEIAQYQLGDFELIPHIKERYNLKSSKYAYMRYYTQITASNTAFERQFNEPTLKAMRTIVMPIKKIIANYYDNAIKKYIESM